MNIYKWNVNIGDIIIGYYGNYIVQKFSQNMKLIYCVDKDGNVEEIDYSCFLPNKI